MTSEVKRNSRLELAWGEIGLVYFKREYLGTREFLIIWSETVVYEPQTVALYKEEKRVRHR